MLLYDLEAIQRSLTTECTSVVSSACKISRFCIINNGLFVFIVKRRALQGPFFSRLENLSDQNDSNDRKRWRQRWWRQFVAMWNKLSCASCNLQYRLKSIRLAFPTISRRVRGYTWPARSARAIRRWRSPGWRTAGRWSRGKPPRIISASSISH